MQKFRIWFIRTVLVNNVLVLRSQLKFQADRGTVPIFVSTKMGLSPLGQIFYSPK